MTGRRSAKGKRNLPPARVVLLKPESFAFSSFPPLNLMALAAYLRKRGFEPGILDLNFPADIQEFQALGIPDRPVLFGVTATTPEFPEAVRLVSVIRKRFPDVPVVLGGIHVSALREAAVREAGADFGVYGEGEETLAELVTALAGGGGRSALSRIRGLIQRDGAEISCNPPRDPVDDIDTLPPPAWDLIRTGHYVDAPWHILQKQEKTGSILTSRGCPFGCSFCASHTTMGRAFRGRSAGKVVDEIEDLHRTYGIGEFLFIDDNFTFERDRAAAICEEILVRGLEISWRTPNGVRIDTLDDSLVKLMKRSGCYLLGFGIESGDPQILRRAGKGLDLDGVGEAVSMVRSHGISTFGFFILGLPGETMTSALRTIDYARRLDLDFAHFGFYAPYPGSREFQRLPDHRKSGGWERYLFIEPYPHDGLHPAILKALIRFAYLSFYLSPSRLKIMTEAFRPKNLPMVSRILYHYLGF